MRLPIEYWKNTLGKLGVRVVRRRMRRKSVDVGCSFETLENRIAMSIDPPVIAGLVASPTSVALGSQITLTPTGVTDPNGDAISQVRVYFDANNDGLLTEADGSPLGIDTNGGDGWSIPVSTVGLPGGTHRFFAVATDATDLDSDPVAATATLLIQPKIIDNGGTGFSLVSSNYWSTSGGGYGGGHQFEFGATGGYAEWTFADLPDGEYMVSATWLHGTNRGTNVPYTVYDGSLDVGTTRVNQRNAPAADIVAGSRPFEDLGSFTVVNSSLVVRMTNSSGDGRAIADAVRIQHIGPVQETSDIRVFNGNTELTDGVSTVNLGTTFFGTPSAAKTLTVKNVGLTDLVLTPLTQADMPTGITLVSSYGATTLARGESTTFQIRLDAMTPGPFAGTLVLASNDPDEANFGIALVGTVQASKIIDNGQSGYAVVSSSYWSSSGGGYGGGHQFEFGATGGYAEWTFGDLPAGSYQVFATWLQGTNRGTSVPYTIYDGSFDAGMVQVNQRVIPAADVIVSSKNFQSLGAFSIINGAMVVRMTNSSGDGRAIADAIRIQYLGEVEQVPDIRVFDSSVELVDGVSTVNLGTTFFGTPASTKTFTVQNSGLTDLVLTPLTQAHMPAGATLVSSYGTTTIPRGGSTTFQVRLSAAAPGNISGLLSLPSNDPDEASFGITLTGIVNASKIIDNGSTGYTTVSSNYWSTTGGPGDQGAYQFEFGATGGYAGWTFEDLPAGEYRISGTWPNNSGWSSVAPYTASDGSVSLATIEVNQKLAPAADLVSGGKNFEDLGVFGVTSGSAVVRLTHNGPNRVVADAIRIEYVGTLPEVRFTDTGSELVVDGAPASVLDFGQSERSQKAVEVIAVTNQTSSTLSLTQLAQANLPAGYLLLSGFGTGTLAPGETAYARIRLDAITPGTYGGTISIQAGSESFDLVVTGEVISVPFVADNSSPEFVTTGSGWQNGTSGTGFGDAHLKASGASAGRTASWTVEGLAPGAYLVYATYMPSTGNTNSAPYSLYDGVTLEQQFTVNQRQVSSVDPKVSGQTFGYVGQINVESGTLKVELNASNLSDGQAIADAIYVVPRTLGEFHGFSAPSEMVTGSAETISGGVVDPDSQLVDAIHVYRDANGNGVLDLEIDQLLHEDTTPGNGFSFDAGSLPSGTHVLHVAMMKTGDLVESFKITVVVSEWWELSIGAMTHGEAKFPSNGVLLPTDVPAGVGKRLHVAPGTPINDAWIAAVWANVTGTSHTWNFEYPEDYSYDFFQGAPAYDTGTYEDLSKRIGSTFNPFNGVTPPSPNPRMIVLEDLYDSEDPDNPNDGDYDDQYWIVTWTPIPPAPIEPGCECLCPAEGATPIPGTGDTVISTGSAGSGSGAGMSRSVSVDINQSAAGSSGLGEAVSTGEFGSGASRSALARLVMHGEDPANPFYVSVVFSGTSAQVFRNIPGPSGPMFERANGLGTTDTLSLEGGQYVFRTVGGDTFTFNTFETSVPELARGGLVSQTDANGNSLEITFNPDGSTAALMSFVAGQSTPVEIQEYVYLTGSDPNAGKVDRIDIKRGDGTLVRSVNLGYYDGTSSFGETGQLASITTRDAAGEVLDARAYRYAPAPSGKSLVQYVFDSASVRRVAAEGLDIATAASALVAPFATSYLEYDALDRVVRHDMQGAGCSSCTDGIGSFSYSYATNPATGLSDSDWHTKTTETRPDGTERIVYSNGRLQTMLEVIRTNDDGTPKQFGKYTKYDDRGLAIWKVSPEAVLLPADLSEIEQYGDLLNKVAGNYEYISDSSGLIHVTTYFVGTTATGTVAGSADRRAASTAVQRGETGTPILQASYTYFVQSAGGSTDTHIASRTEYVTTDGTVTNTTTYAYTYAPGTTQIVSQTTTLPVVSAAQNGSGAADATERVFDSVGRTIWTKDADGFLRYTAYDPQTGSVTKTIIDVDTTQTADFAELPAGWATPSGGGLHLVSTYEVDELGRTTKRTDPNGTVTYTVYDDVNQSVRTYAGWNSVTGRPTGPTQLSRRDLSGTYTESLTFSAAPNLDVNGRPTGTEAITDIESLSRSIMNTAGQVIARDQYFDIPAYSTSTATLGVAGVNFLRTTYAYNNQGHVDRIVNPAGTITLHRYDGRGQHIATYVGTNDSTTNGFKWSPSNASPASNMVLVETHEYDNGGVGNGNWTSTTQYPGGLAEPRTTVFAFDWRNRLVITKAGATADPGTEDTSVNRPLTYVEYDNLGRAVARSVYDGDGVSILDVNADGVPDAPSASLLRSSQTTAFDSRGRTYHTEVLFVDQTTGAIGTTSLTTDTFFDARGNVAMVIAPNGPVTQTLHDGAGRTITSLMLGNIPAATWANATSLASSVILEQVDFDYDPAGNTILTTIRQRFHDASDTATGLLGTPTSGIPARVSYMATYFDVGNRPVASVDLGTNGGAIYVRPGTVPMRSDTVLVTEFLYDSAGRVQDVIDPRGIITRTAYDPLGRTVATILNYTGGAPDAQTDVTTTFQFDTAGRLASRTAVQPTGTPSQVTGYVYGTSIIGGSTITSNDFMVETRYPDRITGLPSTSDRDVYTTNALGQRTSFTDRAGTMHGYIYDIIGRQTADVIAVLGTGVDGSIRRVEQAYVTLGQVQTATTFSDVFGGSVTSQVQRAFNGFGQTITEWQSHTGVVVTLTTPKVQYVYSEAVCGNHSRLVATVYPDGYVVNVTYSGGIDDAISRPSSLTGQRADSSTVATFEAFKYLGMGTVVERSRPEVSINFSLLGTPDDAGDQYAGLDRLGRVVAHHWFEGASSTIVDGYGYTYDRGSNRLTRSNASNAAFSETYTNDALGQLESYLRGDAGSPAMTQDWQFDALGNWTTITTDGIAEAREANAQNELTTVGTATLTYSATGNLTTDAQGNTLAYDAWNRLVAVYDVSSTLVARYEYDGFNRRIVEQVGTLADPDATTAPVRDLFYSLQWQVLEERVRDGSGDIPATADTRYIWSPVYVDAMIARDRNADDNTGTGTGGLEERVYAIQDANWNTTAIIAATGVTGFATGDIINRFAYTPYGEHEILDASWDVPSSSPATPWNHLFQGLKVTEVTSLFYVRHRDYSANLGRFIERDPIGFDAGDNNWYRFVANRPASYTDPSGCVAITLTFAAFIPRNKGVAVAGNPLPAVNWGLEPDPMNVSPFGRRFRMFSTDDRNSGREAGTSRLSTSTTVPIDSAEIGNLAARGDTLMRTEAGESHQIIGLYNGTSYSYIPSSLKRDTSRNALKRKKVTDLSPCVSQIVVEAEGEYPFSSFAPSINYQVTWRLERNRTGVDIIIAGLHDQFPAYAATVDGEVAYEELPKDEGPGVWNLGVGPQIPFIKKWWIP